jgi:hypothetical protein
VTDEELKRVDESLEDVAESLLAVLRLDMTYAMLNIKSALREAFFRWVVVTDPQALASKA